MADKRGAHGLPLVHVKREHKLDAGLSQLHINQRYLMDWVVSVAHEKPNATTLDFGCGKGEVVMAARERGHEAYGVDSFFGGTSAKKFVEPSGHLGNVILEVVDNKIPFEDQSFDLVVSNQVFEHVEDLDSVLDEINRVMKKDGLLVSLFPTGEVMREGHVGIPLAHRPKWRRFRECYTFCLRSFGMGYHKGKKSNRQWAKDALEWVAKYTAYRSLPEVIRSFSRHFAVNLAEVDYIRFRLSTRKSNT